MPTLLWRVLHDVGYPEGQEPVYSWSENQLAEDGLAVVEITVPALGDAPEWDGWHLEFEGRTPVEGAEGAAFHVIRDIMSRFPNELAAALAGTFPRDDPRDAIWVKPQGSALVRGPNEGQASDNHAMSAMYAAIRAYQGLECTYWTLTGLRGDDRLKARKQKKKQARAIASLQEQLADMSLQRDQALESGDSSLQRVHTLTQANNNADHMIGQLVQERNEAWNERNLLRQRVDELEEYNVNLHEEFHALYNGIDPYAPPEAAGMDVDDDEDEPAAAPANNDAATDGSNGDVSDPDDGPEE
jgi:hypothetical protein